MSSALASKSNHAMPVEFFRDILDESFSDAQTRHQVETALDWGRYAGIFNYDAANDTLSRPEPSVPAESPAESNESVPLH